MQKIFYFSSTPLITDNTAKDFTSFYIDINIWFGIEIVNLLLISYAPRTEDKKVQQPTQ
jgi:accessory gene regulator protein AgrB